MEGWVDLGGCIPGWFIPTRIRSTAHPNINRTRRSRMHCKKLQSLCTAGGKYRKMQQRLVRFNNCTVDTTSHKHLINTCTVLRTCQVIMLFYPFSLISAHCNSTAAGDRVRSTDALDTVGWSWTDAWPVAAADRRRLNHFAGAERACVLQIRQTCENATWNQSLQCSSFCFI